jgi:hypothetical protein
MPKPYEGYTDLFVRVTDELAAELDARRGKLNLTRSAYLRRLLERDTGIQSPSGHHLRRPGLTESALVDDLQRVVRRHQADHKGQGESPRSQKEK